MERKLATVLFVDLVSSTALLADADPEIVRRKVSRFFDQVSHCIVTHGGTVEKFAGDAVMAAFGVPLAHEDDAERAVRAGLATLERVRELGLEARIGIESGEVVTEDDTESTFATGEAVNLAARLQQEAKPGEIIIGPGAARLVRGRIELEQVGPLELRGWEKPVAAHRVVCASDPGALVEAVEGERSQQEIAWAARAWTEQLAQAQPLVLMFEDVHWGEEPLLELVEHLAASVREAPLLLLCLARGELLDIRPGWGGGRVRATAIELEPLRAEESAELVRALSA